MRILSGVYPFGTYGGDIILGDGNAARFTNPLNAEKAGIAIIHQELSTFPQLSVAENLFVGHLPKRGPWVDWNRVFSETGKWLTEVGAHCNPETLMGEL